MEQMMIRIIKEIYRDLERACAETTGESLNAEILADFVGARMFDESAEYQAMSYAERTALTFSVCERFC